jgi:hypothetical protein
MESMMNRRDILGLSAIAALGLSVVLDRAVAQQKTIKEQLIGTWTLVSWELIGSDGNKVAPLVGTDPKGILTFDGNSRFSFQIISERPRFASNNRMQGTPEENKAVAQGILSTFGTYSVDEAEMTFTFHNEISSWPNQNRTDGKRTPMFVGDELRYINPGAPAAGPGGNGFFVWKRAPSD